MGNCPYYNYILTKAIYVPTMLLRYTKKSHFFYLLTYLFIIFIWVLLELLVRGGFKSLSSTFYRLNYPINFPTTFSQSIVVCHECFAVHKYSLTHNIMPYWYTRTNQFEEKIALFYCILMPYPCSQFYFDIKFGDRLYSKENRRAWPLHFEYNLSPKLISK